MSNIQLKEWERIDDLQYKGLNIIQDTRGFCFGTDAVLLANFAEIKKGHSVIDLGTGTGIIPILIAGKTLADHIVGLEIQPHMAEMAVRSVMLNDLQHKIKIIEGDLRKSIDLFGAGAFDAVTCNPPYMHAGAGLLNPESTKAISRHEIKCTLEDVVRVSGKLLKVGGKFAMVHRPERLVDILWLMRHYKLEPKRIRLVHPSPGKKANLVLVEGLKNGGAYLKMLEPLYIRNTDGQYSEEINKIYGRQKDGDDG